MKTLWNDWHPVIAKVRRASLAAGNGQSARHALDYCESMADANNISPPNAILIEDNGNLTLQWGRAGGYIRRLAFKRSGNVERTYELPKQHDNRDMDSTPNTQPSVTESCKMPDVVAIPLQDNELRESSDT